MCFNREKTKILIDMGKDAVSVMFPNINTANWEFMCAFARGEDVHLGHSQYLKYSWSSLSNKYSIKTQTCKYFDGGIEFPKPLTSFDGLGDYYYYISGDEVTKSSLDYDEFDHINLSNNIVHKTREDAELHIKAYLENQERIFGGS